MKPKVRIAFVIDEQQISGAFWQWVINHCNGNQLEAGRVFYRAHAKKARHIPGWIRKGFMVSPDGRPGYATLPCRDEYDDGGFIKAWIDENIFKIIGEKELVGASDLINSLIAKMEMR